MFKSSKSYLASIIEHSNMNQKQIKCIKCTENIIDNKTSMKSRVKSKFLSVGIQPQYFQKKL